MGLVGWHPFQARCIYSPAISIAMTAKARNAKRPATAKPPTSAMKMDASENSG